MMLLLISFAVCFLVLNTIFDLMYLLRFLTVYIPALFRGKKLTRNPLEEFSIQAICMPTDIDIFFHMNNSRYLRETDFARYSWYVEAGVWHAIKKLGANATSTGNNIRYRREIGLFSRFTIKTKVLCWDEKAFYVEHVFLTNHDNFVRAVSINKQQMIGTTPSAVIKEILGREVPSPEHPEEVTKLIEFSELSSQKLRKHL